MLILQMTVKHIKFKQFLKGHQLYIGKAHTLKFHLILSLRVVCTIIDGRLRNVLFNDLKILLLLLLFFFCPKK